MQRVKGDTEWHDLKTYRNPHEPPSRTSPARRSKRLPSFGDRSCPNAAWRSSAALIHRGDKPFPFGSGEYRAVPGTWENADILISHVSINFDRAGFQRDINVVFPIDRLRDLAAEGVIGSVAAAARRLAWPASRPRPGRLLPRRSWTAFCRPCRISIRPLWRCGFWRTI